MDLSFTGLDWAILGGYLAILTATAIWSSRGDAATTKDYFLAGNAMPAWLIAISVLSTTQSAATFLGGPDFGYRGDYTYLTSFAGALVAALLVAWVLLPRFYAIGATTVYELLEVKFGSFPSGRQGLFI
jgi:solute:Na+ symporter, SSS family